MTAGMERMWQAAYAEAGFFQTENTEELRLTVICLWERFLTIKVMV